MPANKQEVVAAFFDANGWTVTPIPEAEEPRAMPPILRLPLKRKCEDTGITPPAPCGYPVRLEVTCESHDSLACESGDVYWFDSCGGREELQQDCAANQSCSGAACVAADTLLFANDFQHRPLGKYETRSAFINDWSTTGWGDRGEEIEVVTDPAGSEQNLVAHLVYPFYDVEDFVWVCLGDPICFDSEHRRIYFDAPPSVPTVVRLNGVGPAAGGCQLLPSLGGSFDAAELRYRVRFGPGFEPVDGGKLPGFVGGDLDCDSGCGNSTDCCDVNGDACGHDNCDGIADGFTARMMFQPYGASYYMYHADKTVPAGDSRAIEGLSSLFDGNWHEIRLRLVLNDVGAYNGSLQAWYDGVAKPAATGIRFRTGANTFGIDRISFTTFFGGSSATRCSTKDGGACGHEIPYSSQHALCAEDPADPCSDLLRYSDGSVYFIYAPRKTEHVYFDDIVVTAID